MAKSVAGGGLFSAEVDKLLDERLNKALYAMRFVKPLDGSDNSSIVADVIAAGKQRNRLLTYMKQNITSYQGTACWDGHTAFKWIDLNRKMTELNASCQSAGVEFESAPSECRRSMKALTRLFAGNQTNCDPESAELPIAKLTKLPAPPETTQPFKVQAVNALDKIREASARLSKSVSGTPAYQAFGLACKRLSSACVDLREVLIDVNSGAVWSACVETDFRHYTEAGRNWTEALIGTDLKDSQWPDSEKIKTSMRAVFQTFLDNRHYFVSLPDQPAKPAKPPPINYAGHQAGPPVLPSAAFPPKLAPKPGNAKVKVIDGAMTLTTDMCMALENEFQTSPCGKTDTVFLHRKEECGKSKTSKPDTVILGSDSIFFSFIKNFNVAPWSPQAVAAVMRWEHYVVIPKKIDVDFETYCDQVRDKWQCILTPMKSKSGSGSGYFTCTLQLARRLGQAGVKNRKPMVLSERLIGTARAYRIAAYYDNKKVRLDLMVVLQSKEDCTTLLTKDAEHHIGMLVNNAKNGNLDAQLRLKVLARSVVADDWKMLDKIKDSITHQVPQIAKVPCARDPKQEHAPVPSIDVARLAKMNKISVSDIAYHGMLLETYKPMALFMWTFNSTRLSLNMLVKSLGGPDKMDEDCIMESGYLTDAMKLKKMGLGHTGGEVKGRIANTETEPSLLDVYNGVKHGTRKYTHRQFQKDISDFYDTHRKKLEIQNRFVVFRGTQNVDTLTSKTEEGMLTSQLPFTFQLNTNCSFSDARWVAGNFQKGVYLCIDVPEKFSSGIWIDSFTAYPGEREFLIRAFTKIKVRDIVCTYAHDQYETVQRVNKSGRMIMVFGEFVENNDGLVGGGQQNDDDGTESAPTSFLDIPTPRPGEMRPGEMQEMIDLMADELHAIGAEEMNDATTDDDGESDGHVSDDADQITEASELEVQTGADETPLVQQYDAHGFETGIDEPQSYHESADVHEEASPDHDADFDGDIGSYTDTGKDAEPDVGANADDDAAAFVDSSDAHDGAQTPSNTGNDYSSNFVDFDEFDKLWPVDAPFRDARAQAFEHSSGDTAHDDDSHDVHTESGRDLADGTSASPSHALPIASQTRKIPKQTRPRWRGGKTVRVVNRTETDAVQSAAVVAISLAATIAVSILHSI